MPATPGFAARAATFISRRVAQDQANQVGSPSVTRSDHWAVLEAGAAYIRSLGDDDAAVVALWRLSGGAADYEAGKHELAVMDRAGFSPMNGRLERVPAPAAFLADLVDAAADDFRERTERPVESLRQDRDRAVKELRKLQETTVDRAIEQTLRDEIERKDAAYADLRGRYKALRTRLEEFTAGAPATPLEAATSATSATEQHPAEADAPRRAQLVDNLPKGVRRRGSGYQIYWRDAQGRQAQEGGFRTVEHAVAAREAHLDAVAAEKTGAVTGV